MGWRAPATRPGRARVLQLIARFALLAIFSGPLLMQNLAAAPSTFKILNDQHRGAHARSNHSLAGREQHRGQQVASARPDQQQVVAADLLVPEQTFTSSAHFDDDDDDDDREQSALKSLGLPAATYTLEPHGNGQKAPARRLLQSSANSYGPVPSAPSVGQASAAFAAAGPSAGARLSGLLGGDTSGARYQVQVHRTLKSSTDDDGRRAAIASRQNKKFLNIDKQSTKHKQRPLFKPIVLTSDVQVRSDLVLVRDHEGPGPAHSRGGDGIWGGRVAKPDSLGGLPVKTLSQRVQLARPVELRLPESTDYNNNNNNNNNIADQYDDTDDHELLPLAPRPDPNGGEPERKAEKLFIIRKGHEPNQSLASSIRFQLTEQLKSSLGGGGGVSGDHDDRDEQDEEPSSPNGIHSEPEEPPGKREQPLRVAASNELAESREPEPFLKRKFGVPFSKLVQASEARPQPPPQPQPQLRPAPASTQGIRVTIGNGTRQLIVNSRGLITAAKPRPLSSVASTDLGTQGPRRPYNPSQLFASSQTSYTLNPIETMGTSRPRRPALRPSHANGGHPVKARPMSGVIKQQGNSSVLVLSPMREPAHEHHDLWSPPASSHAGDDLRAPQTYTTASTITTASGAITTPGNFHHNPPYRQHLGHTTLAPTSDFANFTMRPAPTARPNNRFHSTSTSTSTSTGKQHHQHHAHHQPPVRVPVGISGSRNGTSNSTMASGHLARPASFNQTAGAPYEPSLGADLVSEPANTLHVHAPLLPGAPASSNSSALAHLQPSLATISLRPTKIRIKLLQSLFGGGGGGGGHKLPQKHFALANQTSGSPPAPLLSSTVANNVAALLAQKLGALVRPPAHMMQTTGHLPLNSLFGFRVGSQSAAAGGSPHSTSLQPDRGQQALGAGKLRRPFVAQAAPNVGLNRRTAGVGSLLVSGLIYGLTVLPALMALTGINPLSSALDASPASPAAPVASRAQQQQQASEKQARQTSAATKARQRRRPPSALGDGDSTGASATHLDAFGYLLPLLSPAAGEGVQAGLEPGQAAAASLESTGAHQLDSLALGTVESGQQQQPPIRFQFQNEAQSSALKSLYAPPPTVLESFGSADLSSLLDEQSGLEGDWPPAALFTGRPAPLLASSASNGRPAHRQQQLQHHHHHHHHRAPSASWPQPDTPAAFAADEIGQPRGPFVRHDRDLGQNSGAGGGGDHQTLGRPSQSGPNNAPGPSASFGATSAQPPASSSSAAAISFDDRSATSGGSFKQPAHESRRGGAAASVAALIQVAPPTDQVPAGDLQSILATRHQDAAWSVGTNAATETSGMGANQVQRNHGDGAPGAAYSLGQRLEDSERFRHQVNYLLDAQSQQLRQQQQLAHLADDLAILGPYRPPAAGERPTQTVDFGGLRQRRTVTKAASQEDRVLHQHHHQPPASVHAGDTQVTRNPQLAFAAHSLTMNQAAQRPSPSDFHQSEDKSVRSLQSSHDQLVAKSQQRAPKWANESDWRAIAPPLQPVVLPISSPRASSSWRQDGMPHNPGSAADVEPPGARKRSKSKSKKLSASAKRKRPSSSRAGASGQSNKSPVGSATATTPRTMTPTDTPTPFDGNPGESELLMAHSMAMGSRVLNEQLTGHHQ